MNYFNQESERLTYRKLTEEDIPSWIEFFIDNDRLKFLGIDLQKSHKDLAEGWIKAQFSKYTEHGLGHLAVVLKDSGEFIGMGGILPRELDGNQEYEIAYSLKPTHWGKGYATEVAIHMKEYGMKHIKTDRFVSIIDVANLESNKVAIKNGMSVLFQTKYLGMNVNVFGINKPEQN